MQSFSKSSTPNQVFGLTLNGYLVQRAVVHSKSLSTCPEILAVLHVIRGDISAGPSDHFRKAHPKNADIKWVATIP